MLVVSGLLHARAGASSRRSWGFSFIEVDCRVSCPQVPRHHLGNCTSSNLSLSCNNFLAVWTQKVSGCDGGCLRTVSSTALRYASHNVQSSLRERLGSLHFWQTVYIAIHLVCMCILKSTKVSEGWTTSARGHLGNLADQGRPQYLPQYVFQCRFQPKE